MSQEKIFADGFSFKRNDNAPNFVVGRLSMKVEDAVVFLKANAKNGWVNVDIKQAQAGNYYCELDTWTPNNNSDAASSSNAPKQQAAPAPAAVVEEEDDLPF